MKHDILGTIRYALHEAHSRSRNDFAYSIVVALSSVCMLWVLLAVYRITLHPLAKVPGPRLAALTRL